MRALQIRSLVDQLQITRPTRDIFENVRDTGESGRCLNVMPLERSFVIARILRAYSASRV